MVKNNSKNNNKISFAHICPDVNSGVYQVEASAGAGKTYVLANRYLTLLLGATDNSNEIPLKNILAITFTNKAMFEMKERILEFLKRIALDDFVDLAQKKSLIESLNLEEKHLQKKAGVAINYIIRNYDFFMVRTIHSFLNSILSSCSVRLDYSSKFNVKDDYKDFLVYSLDVLIDKISSDAKVKKLFLNFLRQYLFIEVKTGWLVKKDILSTMRSLFEAVNRQGSILSKIDFKDEELIELKSQTCKDMIRLRGMVFDGTNKTFIKSLDKFVLENRGLLNIDEVSDFFRHDEFPVNKDHVVPAQVSELWCEIKKSLMQISEIEAFSLLNPYVDIYNNLSDIFKKLARKEDTLFVSELGKKANSILQQDDLGVSEIYLRLALRIKHYLIDEFQDTSFLEWYNINALVEDALSSRGSLFYVGDKKQAIYRFKGGDIDLFDYVKNKFQRYDFHSQILETNYRSQKHIVEFNNQVFSASNIKRFLENLSQRASRQEYLKLSSEDMEYISLVYENSHQKYKNENTAGYVKVEEVESLDKESAQSAIKNKVISLVKELSSRYSYSDICILTRKNDDCQLVTQWLLSMGVPVWSDKTLNIKENYLIKEIVSFLKFLHSPLDNISFCAFVSGDIFTKVSGLDKQIIRNFIFKLQNVSRTSREDYVCIYTHFRSEFNPQWNSFISSFFKNVGLVPVYEFIVSIMSEFKILEGFGEYQGYFMKFLEFGKVNEKEYGVSIGAFLEYFENIDSSKLYISMPTKDAVNVLTVHKSKGLDFGVVITPFLELNTSIGSMDNDSIENKVGDSLCFVGVKDAYAKYSQRLSTLYKGEYKKSLLDELNNIYVCFTRAKYELYVFIPKKRSGSNNKVVGLIEDTLFECGQKVKFATSEKKQEQVPALPISDYRNWIHWFRDEFDSDGSLINRKSRVKGKIVHYALSFIGNIRSSDIKKNVDYALEMAKQKFPFFDDFKSCQDILSSLIANGIFKKFFFVENGQVYQEKQIVTKSGHTKTVDRLIVTGEHVYVVDYKSSQEDKQAHQKQVAEYINTLKQVYPKLLVKGFLLYIDDMFLEEVKETYE